MLERKRLRQKAEFRIRWQVAGKGVFRISRYEDELQVGIGLAQFAEQRRAVHLGHHDVGHHDIHLAFKLFHDVERFSA
ncbi:hypothetical protein D3C86_1976660 [compost metagenome]